MTAHRAEGVIRFESFHRTQPLDSRVHGEAVRALAGWHQVLSRLGLVGRDPARYGGFAYGNLSARLDGSADPRDRHPFIVTGSQTAGRGVLTLDDFCIVERWDSASNRVESCGPVPPSSESLTHGALYETAPAVRVVFHAHAPVIWRHARRLGIPATTEDVANGTPEMAAAVRLLHGGTETASLGIIVMGGHEDGVVAFGSDAGAAGSVLVRWLARALELEP